MRGTALIAWAVGCVLLAGAAHAADNLELPPGPNRALVYGQCRTCHDLQYLIDSAGIPRDSWDEVLDSMKQYGLRIPPEQRAKILDYLGSYLGPNPAPVRSAAAPPAAQPDTIDGAALYNEQCAACHQPKGEGAPGQFPPLAHNADVFASRDFPVRVVLFGMKGRIAVDGHEFDGEMPALNFLSDAQIAAVVRYVRNAWGNEALRPKAAAPVDAATVEALRGRNDSPDQVFAYRKQVKAAAGQ